MNQTTSIEVENLSIKYGKHLAVKDVTFDINKGDFVGVIGENGSGKTTLVKAILGAIDPYKGSVHFEEGVRLGYLPQNIMRADKIFPATSMEVALMGLIEEKKFPKIVGKKDKEKVKDLFVQLGIEHLLHKRIGELSGGQQQRVMLARALVSDPDILFLDEPTSALDSVIEQSFLDALQKRNQEKQTTIVLITHDLATVGAYINKVVYMNQSLEYVGSFDQFCKSMAHSPYIHMHSKSACGHKAMEEEMNK